MSFDDVKEDTRDGEIVAYVQPAMPDLRRGAETLRPLPQRRGVRALVETARQRLAWTHLPGLTPRETDQSAVSFTARLVRDVVLFVLIPTFLVGLYLFGFAADQYVARSQFAVRGNVEPMEEVTLGTFSNLIQKHNSQDSYIVRDFIQSPTLVHELEKSIGLSKMFSRPEADFFTRYDPNQPVEELTKRWRRHVEAKIDTISGVIRLSVRAFTPEDALLINREVVRRAEAFINELSQRARGDILNQAQADAATAQERLRKAHLAIQGFRNQWGLIDPIKTAEGTFTTLMVLRKEKLKLETDLQILRGSNLDERSRSIQTLAANVTAIDQQMKSLQDELTSTGGVGGGGSNLTEALLAYEGLLVERTIAQKLEESANLLLNQARIGAVKQHIFLAVFEPPVLPTASLYPERGHLLFVSFFGFVVLWSSISLVTAGIKDQRL